MASKGLAWISEEMEAPCKGLVVLPLRFKFNTAAAPTVFTGAEHLIASVAHTSLGVWTITLKEAFRNWRGVFLAMANLELDASADSCVHVGPMAEAAGTIVVRVLTAGTLADIAPGSNDGNWCNLMLALKYSTAIDGSGI